MAAMGARFRKRLGISAGLAVAVACATAAVAFGALVTIYSNNFSGASKGHQLAGAQGSHCDKKVRGNGSLEVTVKRGPEECGYRLPVEGEGRQPDHDLQARFKLLKLTPKELRRNAYVGLQVRAGGGSDYELRVFPKGHHYVIKRTPKKGSGSFPVSGKNKAIKPMDKINTIRFQAFGHVIKAWVNGSKLADVNDSKANAVRGRRAELIFGSGKHTDGDVVARVDDVKLSVPKP
jgi:hypothetical protein